MKKKFFIGIILSTLLIIFTTSNAMAANKLSISSASFKPYINTNGITDTDLVNVSVAYTSQSSFSQIAILVTTEDLTEITDSNTNKVIYIDQDDATSDNTFNFVLSRERIENAINKTDIQDTPIYITICGTGDVTGDQKSFSFEDPSSITVKMGDIFTDQVINVKDSMKLSQYLADWDVEMTESELQAADVYKDSIINVKDSIKLAQFLAGWEITLD